MQQKPEIPKPYYFNNWLLSAKLLALLIIPYCLLFSTACSQNSAQRVFNAQLRPAVSEFAVNLNTASVEELEKLPHIGEELARRIVEHREKYGRFRRAENLILVRGMSDKKFRDLQSLVKVE